MKRWRSRQEQTIRVKETGARLHYDGNMPIPERLNPVSARVESPLAPRIEQARSRLIVALDAPDEASALGLVNQLEGTCGWFKVGLELFVASGPRVVEKLVGRGHNVFLDLKLHDIPNTVAGAVRSASRLKVKMLTLHASGGPAMLAAGRAALEGVPEPPELLAVTVLTSMDGPQLNASGIERRPAEQVSLLVDMGMKAGILGFVCSASEVRALRELSGPEGVVLVVPGIRPSGSEVGDQKRVATPASALKNGASYLVVGRPITQAEDPAEAAEAILKEMAEALG